MEAIRSVEDATPAMSDVNTSESNRTAPNPQIDHTERNILLTLVLVASAEASVLVWLFS
jgi:hypothetical protein